MEKKEKSKLEIAKKTLKVLMKILYQLLIFVCVILIIIIVMQRITDSNQSFYGYRLFRIISGSMIPKFNVGEVVICKETPGDEIKIGDAIVYRGKIGELNNKLVMHEVVAVNHNEETGALEFYAKGINNNEEDPKVKTDQILGVVKFKSRALTVLYSLATSIYSSFVIVTVLVINVFVSFKSPREPRRPKQLVESETKQNENVKIENDDTENLEEKKIKEENSRIELKNEEQQDVDSKKMVKDDIKESKKDNLENENIEILKNDNVKKQQDRKAKKSSNNREVSNKVSKTNEVKENKKTKTIKKETTEISEKKEKEKDVVEEKKTKNKK